MENTSYYSYVVLCASFFAIFLGPGVNYATGIIHVALLDTFKEDVTHTAWAGSLFASMFALMGPVASLVINMSDCRTCVCLAGLLCMIGFSTSYFVTSINVLFISYAITAGLGTGLAQTGALVILGYYFPSKTSLASGICIAGAGVGMFVHPTLIQYLYDSYGLHGTFLIVGSVTFNVTVCGMLMRPSPFEKERQAKILDGLSLHRKIRVSLCSDCVSFADVVTNVSFIMFVLSVFCFSIGLSTIYLYLADYYITNGSSFQEASFSISVSGIGSVISRVLVGFASSDERIGSFTIFSSLPALTAIVTLFIPFFTASSPLKILYGFLFGIYTGGVWVLVNTLTLQILGMRYFATGVGLVFFSCGVGSLVGPPLAAILMSLATLCGFLSTIAYRHQSLKDEHMTEKSLTSNNASQEIERKPRSSNYPCRNSDEFDCLMFKDKQYPQSHVDTIVCENTMSC